MKLASDSTSKNGFSLYHYDRLGGMTATIFPDKVQIQPAGKPVSPVTATLPGFDERIWHTYRLVRPNTGAQRRLYWNLYIDENPVPIIVDARSSGFSAAPFITIGPFRTPTIHELLDDMVYTPFQKTGGRAEVRFVRWINEAVGPKPCP